MYRGHMNAAMMDELASRAREEPGPPRILPDRFFVVWLKYRKSNQGVRTPFRWVYGFTTERVARARLKQLLERNEYEYIVLLDEEREVLFDAGCSDIVHVWMANRKGANVGAHWRTDGDSYYGRQLKLQR